MPGKSETWADYSGQKFNSLTFLRKSKVRDRYGSAFLWEVQCDCGKIILAKSTHVLSSRKKHCGCLPSEGKRIDRTNQRLGYLTFIRKLDEKRFDTCLWEVKCDCGNTIKETYNKLSLLIFPSCGCKNKNKTRIESLNNFLDNQEK
jgi:hypothetical protein